jgi:hypothetical protein
MAGPRLFLKKTTRENMALISRKARGAASLEFCSENFPGRNCYGCMP